MPTDRLNARLSFLPRQFGTFLSPPFCHFLPHRESHVKKAKGNQA